MQRLGKASSPDRYHEYMPLLERSYAPMKSGDFATADALIAEARALNGEAAIVDYFAGMSALMQQRPQDAVEPLARAHAVAGGNVEVARAYGEALAGVKRWGDANAVLAKAYEAEPRYPGVVAIWGQVLYQGGRVDDGLARLAEAALLTPDASEAQLVLFRHLLDAGIDSDLRYDALVAAAARMEALGALDARRLESMAVALRRVGRYAESVPALVRLVEQRPDDAAVVSVLADSLVRAERYAEAAAAAEQAVSLGATDAATWYTWGAALWELGKKGPAAEKMRAAVEKDPKLGPTLPDELQRRVKGARG